jgi:hypothetical protein
MKNNKINTPGDWFWMIAIVVSFALIFVCPLLLPLPFIVIYLAYKRGKIDGSEL